ncbi:predicted protein [Sclerotinia sclerotiorum 1980 UF-70]|uniref:Uncharacterized protein n=1 Tax=Sclerotinia sclerotiorum (strain ATCC 18683 / 1980 / Ss-1) TaxID=665079 RepID=A7EMT4_SCLS1|nr:predicted protein [Sclerotinia sclerotiorum 1980 UF-70]EDO04150.1 predicted protein [Sclerotinia sclerotiorum 1980 UF-70]
MAFGMKRMDSLWSANQESSCQGVKSKDLKPPDVSKDFC